MRYFGTESSSFDISIEGTKLPQFRYIAYSNRPDRAAQLAEHWASIPKVVGSNRTVARHIFQACPVWIYTQSNITQAQYKKCFKHCFVSTYRKKVCTVKIQINMNRIELSPKIFK